jgi:hypothetical protein
MRRFDWRDLIGKPGQHGVFWPGFRPSSTVVAVALEASKGRMRYNPRRARESQPAATRRDSPSVCADIPQKGVRKSGTPNIIEVLAGLVSHDG